VGVRQQCALREDCDKCRHCDSYCQVKVPLPKSKPGSVRAMKNTVYVLFVFIEGFSSSWKL